MLKLFGMSSRDYRRFMNFLAAHDCSIGVREFRSEAASMPVEKSAAFPVAASRRQNEHEADPEEVSAA